MLQTVTGVLVLLIVALAGYRRSFARPGWPRGIRFFFLTGTQFLFIGLALGEHFLGLLDRPTIERLGPVFSLGLGYFGLIFGLQLEFEKLLRFPLQYLSSTLIQAGITFLFVFILFFWLFHQMDASRAAFIPALAIGAVACCSSPTIVALSVRETRPVKSAGIDLIRYIAGLDTIIGFTLFAAAACLVHTSPPPLGPACLPGLQWMALSIAFGMGMGYLLHLLTQTHCGENELWVFIIGIIIFSGGVSLFFELSPLFVTMVAGITAANLPGSKDRVFMAIFRQEKPFHIVFLILAGAVWQPGLVSGLVLAGFYLLSRTAGKICGGLVAASWLPVRFQVSPLIGLGLLSQSGVAIAMAMDLYLSGSGSNPDLLVAMLISAVLVNELFSPAMAGRFLAGSREGAA